MKGEELETLVWDTWMQDLDTKAKNTKRGYLGYFKVFINRWDLTPGELYEMRKTDLKSDEPLNRKQIERMVKTSMSEFQKAGYSASTCNNLRKSVGSFFESMDMDLNFKRKDTVKGEYKGQLAITSTQIAKMHEQMNYGRLSLRNKSILLSLKDSGLRISDLCTMDYGYWLLAETILNEHGETFKVFEPKHTEKMKVIAYVHLGPESVAAIEEYLEDRQDRGELLTEESPLFLVQQGGRITEDSLKNLFSQQARKMRLKRISAHSLRKFHTTKLEGAGIPKDWIKKLQGKKTDPYTRPEDDISEKYPGFNVLTERYIDNYDVLRVFDKSMEKGEIVRLREELERVRGKTPPEGATILDRLQALENHIYNNAPSPG